MIDLGLWKSLQPSPKEYFLKMQILKNTCTLTTTHPPPIAGDNPFPIVVPTEHQGSQGY